MACRYEEENGIVGKRFTSARKNPYKGIERVISLTGKYKDTVLKYNDYIERNILLRSNRCFLEFEGLYTLLTQSICGHLPRSHLLSS